MRATWLARRLALDGNPLRRRADKIAACLAAALVAVFLAGAPVLAMVAVGWAGRTAATGHHAAGSWRQVPAVSGQAAAGPAAVEPFGHSWMPTRWTAPDPRSHAGQIPARGALPAGRTVPPQADTAGTPAGPPPARRAVLTRQAAAAVTAVAVLEIVLLCLARAGQWVLDRRRLADWEAEWATVGPQWTRRFRSSG